jgi:hypothetical protein
MRKHQHARRAACRDQQPRYDPSKVFVPVAKVSQNHEVLVVNPAFPAS